MTHLEGYKKEALRSPVFIILEVICELLLPLAMAKIVNEAIPSGDIGRIFLLGGVMLLLSVLAMVFGVLSAKYATFASQGFGANLRQCLFDKIQSFSFADIDRFSSASLITRTTNDVNAMTMMLNMGLRMLWRAPVMLIVALVITIKLNAKLSLVLLTVIPVLALGIGVIMKICSRLFQVMQQKIDGLNNTLQENLVAIRVVKAFVRQNHEESKFKTANDQLTQAGMNVGLRVITMMPLMTVAMNAATVGVLYLGGKMVMKAQFDLGDLQAILTYVSQILMSVMMVAMTLLQLSRAQACARRINEVLDTEPSVENSDRSAARTLPAPRGEVEFRDVSFKYVASGTGDDVLEHISFTVRPGQFVAIVGGTGTGKSSLVNLIPRFYDATSGQVLVDGVDVKDYAFDALYDKLGYATQKAVLFSGSIRDNVFFGESAAAADDGALSSAIELSQAKEFVDKLPEGTDHHIAQLGRNVSGGQKQRLSIARALARRPEILVFDDSFSALDYRTDAKLREGLAKQLHDITKIIVAQRISTIRHADKIIVLDRGEAVGMGTHEELMQNCEVYREIATSQLSAAELA